MEKQKICIIGGSLTGLVTAISLSKFNCDIDLVTGNFNKNIQSSRTLAISEDNFDYLNSMNIFKKLERDVWSCSKMKLYTEEKKEKFCEIFELNKENNGKKIFYILENYKMIKFLMKKIEKTKSIHIIKNKKVSKIYDSGSLKSIKFGNSIYKYNLVIICSGYKSTLIKNTFNDRIIQASYKEFAVTTILEHKPINNNTARQIFLDNTIFALLPINKNKTSIVWSVKNSMRDRADSFFKNKIRFYSSMYLKNIKFISDIERNDLNFLIRNKYYFDRTLLFGDALHLMHPYIGQSFNMTLRDLKSLKEILKRKINLGLDIGSSDVLLEFSREAKPRNFSFSIGSDILKKSLQFKKVRNDVIKILNKSNFVKDIVFDIANRGLRF
tara:strand:+ start:52 stop:1200 length:1149 start_codon:yes stop_codon:yes gene_type:complete